MKFHHVGIFTASLAQGRTHLAALGVGAWGPEIDDPGLKVRVQFGFDAAGLCYELVAPGGTDDPVSPVLASKRTILNHLAYRVPDLDTAFAALRAGGAMPLGPPSPAVAFCGHRVMFLLSPLGMIVELIDCPDGELP